MPSLKEYRDQIKSIKSTRKITSAMKMVAASKLRRAQEQAQASQPYARMMADIMARVAANVTIGPDSSPLLIGTGSDQRHLLVVVTADRGLCGGFNANLIREAQNYAVQLMSKGKDVFILCVGRKGAEALRRNFRERIWKEFTGFGAKSRLEYADAKGITDLILQKFEADTFDVCTLIYNEFRSVIAQKPMRQQLIPFTLPPAGETKTGSGGLSKPEDKLTSPYDFEPTEEEILNALLPRNLGVQIFRALLDSAAGEQAARMTAMDNATRNAGEMINGLSLQYNRARQAHITKELIEIISGAEAV